MPLKSLRSLRMKKAVFTLNTETIHFLFILVRPWIDFTVKGLSAATMPFSPGSGVMYFLEVPMSSNSFIYLSATVRVM